jgi:hypothetical protein
VTATTAPPVQRTAVGLRRDVILDQMQVDHEEAAHAVGDVRDCPTCLERYGLDGLPEPWISRRPRSFWDELGEDDDWEPPTEEQG